METQPEWTLNGQRYSKKIVPSSVETEHPDEGETTEIPNCLEDKNNSDSELFEATEPTIQASSDKIKKIGKVGRKRKYESSGIEDIPPVKEVVIFRFKMGRHWPGMSDDMREWYEFYYFTKPNRLERAKDARDYERHVKSWERGRKWIAEECGIEALGDSRKIIAIRKRSNG